MYCIIYFLSLLLLCFGVCGAAKNANAAYFALMRQYLGDEGFETVPCLVEQEKHGWTYGGSKMSAFTLGLEGAGHHLMETVLGSISNINGNGGQRSVPTQWREKQNLNCPFAGQHPDIHGMIDSGWFIAVMLRYPPSSLLSAMRRFAICNGGHKPPHIDWPPKGMTLAEADAAEPLFVESSGCFKKKITAKDEVLAHLDSVSIVDDIMRNPNFDCNKVVFLPYEALTQHPDAFAGPLAQATGQSNGAMLTKLKASQNHQPRKKGPRSSYELHELCCHDLGLSTEAGTAAARAGKPSNCTSRIYHWAKEYFDERR